jgi:F-type H+-transporting ATPase subunit alpha
MSLMNNKSDSEAAATSEAGATLEAGATSRVRPQVNQLLETLREEAAQAEGTRVYDLGFVKRVSAEMALRTGAAKLHPDVKTLADLLRLYALDIEPRVRFHPVGTVQHIGNGVARLSGLPSARTYELVTFPTGVQGLVLNLEHEHVDVIMLGPEEGIQGGDLVTGTGERLRIPVGHQLLGRIVNPLGEPLDEIGTIEASEYRFLERDAPGIIEREPVDEPLQTGWKMIDALVPIGRGQRELILGDRQTGKTTLAVDAILNQRDSGVLCVYVAVGQKKSTTLRVVNTFREFDALRYTTVVIASPDDPPALRYLAPYAGCTMAEFLMEDGRDVLIVYDDLSKHADAYRELSLLLRRPPGREAYPGDIFYLHSRLLERACKLSGSGSSSGSDRDGGSGRDDGRNGDRNGDREDGHGPDSESDLDSGEQGGSSLTALPIVETQRGNISAYIPTNLISITDGQIVLDADMFNRGIKPAVDAGDSVSRVGGKAQTPAMREVSGRLRLDLAQYESVSRFARFGTEVDEATRQQIQRGQRLQRALTQPPHQPRSLAAQILILLAVAEGVLDDIETEHVMAFEERLVTMFEKKHPGLYAQLDREGELTEEIRAAFAGTMSVVRQSWFEERSS